jgi:hypothetical protein
MAKKLGRPTKYTEKMPDIVRGYADTDKVPTLPGIANVLGVNKDTVWEWGHDGSKPAFSEALSYLMQKQEESLIRNGLYQVWHSGFAKFLLSANFGYKEKSDITTNDKDLTTAGIFVDGGLKDEDK